nr:hypothetical protein [uncultured Celeribacter sp.]
MTIAYLHPFTLAQREGSNRQTNDDYKRVILQRGRFRVVICRERRQWLFQRRRPNVRAGATAWDTLGYCITRKGLIRLSRQHMGTSWHDLFAFPDHFKSEDWA